MGYLQVREAAIAVESPCGVSDTSTDEMDARKVGK